MRILLVSANTETINMPVLPLGLAIVAAAAQNAGHEVTLLNLMACKDALHALVKSIEKCRPQVIGISVRNIDDQNMKNPRFLLAPVKDMVDACRGASRATIVLGGAGYSIFPQAALDYLGADLGIHGEGEAVFPELLKRLESSRELSGLAGLHLPRQGKAGAAATPKKISDFLIPIPDIHLWVPSTLEDQAVWLPFQTRRGCPMNCLYCSTATIEGRIIRKHPPAEVIAAIFRCVRAGYDHFFFVDNTFNLPPSYARNLCDRLVAANLSIAWRCILYPWKADAELIEKMAAAGCKEVSLGFESGSAAMLRKMNKRFTAEDVRRISDRLKHCGIRRTGFLLLGGPGETRDTVLESLHFADLLDLEAVKVTVGIRIYPHTPLARTAFAEGKIDAHDSLLQPTFYIADGLGQWLDETVEAWMRKRPNWLR